MWAADNFARQIRQKHPRLRPACLVMRNEHGARKLAMTYLKPTVLPFAHLFDVDACAKFVSDYLFYTPVKPVPGNNSGAIGSPTLTLGKTEEAT